MRPFSDLDPWRLYEGAESDHPEDPAERNTGRIADPLPEHTPLYRLLAKLLANLESVLRARGGEGLRRAIIFFWVLIGVGGILLMFGPIINKPLSFDDVLDSAKLETVDWIMNDAVVRHDIDRDDTGAFVTTVTETFSVEMNGSPLPSLQRILPTQYQGNGLQLEVVSVTIDGEKATVQREDSLTYSTITLRQPDGEALHGEHEITLEYVLHHLATVETDDISGQLVDEVTWNMFAADLLQAARGITVEVTLPTELDESLIRQPLGSVAWLLLGASAWLDVDDELTAEVATDGRVGYSFSNDQNLPPHAEAHLRLVFETGTFTMPPHTPLFWVQTFGPLVPLMLLVVLLLFALAARKVAWADAHGRPWFVAQHTPPKKVSPALAAQLLRRPRPFELASTLGERPARGTKAWVYSVAKVAARAGRAADCPRAIARYLAAPERAEAHKQGLRRRPAGYVRDAFVWAPIALTLVQWGLVRQLSERTVLSVVWWPFAFVCLSTALAAVVVYIALSADPLTHKGALVKQHLKGLELYATQTQTLGRGPLNDPVLPYAVLFGRTREAGEAVVELAQHETGDRDVTKGYKGSDHLRTSAVVAAIASIVLLAGSIVTAATQPYPYPYNYDTIIIDRDLPGTLRTSINEFRSSAELSRDEDGRAKLSVREDLVVNFETGNGVPQFSREWPNLRLGQSLDLRVEEVSIDGEPVEWREVPRPRSMGVVTEMQRVLEGEHEVQVTYTLDSAAVAANVNGEQVDQVRWAALYDHWESDLSWIDQDIRHVSLEFSVAPDLVDSIVEAGWITDNWREPDLLWERGNAVAPFNYSEPLEAHDAPPTQMGEQQTLPDGSLHATIELQESWVGGWAYELTNFSDLGAGATFEAGTFEGTSQENARAETVLHNLPNVAVVALTVVLILASICLIWVGRLRDTARASATLRAFSFVVMPIAGIAQFVLFFWATSDMPQSNDRFALMGWLTLASITLGGIQLWSVLAKPIAPTR